MSTCITDSSVQASEGDFTVCISCGGISRFDEALTQVGMTEEDLDDAVTKCDFGLLMRASALIKARGPIDE